MYSLIEHLADLWIVYTMQCIHKYPHILIKAQGLLYMAYTLPLLDYSSVE